ncbi:hypothetical protein NA57DRAFT_49257 [Rhizodiscina lignyota]|uniref:Thioesterase atnL n=1 Tax=Rhizodiscina lignyota TaxID=1504668 RepID=A0A9P4M335_9PEZI|nr:hypothetical protein NA57DRAFT_49257 [Rhizodiscina lignyota]
MSALGRIQALSGVVVGASVFLIPSVRKRILSMLGGYISWKTVAILLAILNFKNLPFVWHLRIFTTMYYQIFIQRTKITPQMLFNPVITTTRSPLAECDYNGHKSNSTYFSDLDEARTGLVSAILRRGIRNSGKQLEMPIDQYREAVGKPDLKEIPKGMFKMALGAVSCHFRREVQPYQKVEIWTRLLAWDRKWLYWVSHIVEAGTVKPASYSLQPWKKGRGQKEETAQETQERIAKAKKAVLAVSVAKYVVKKGRLTIPPELVLQNSEMLPPKPRSAPPAANIAVYSKASELSPPVAIDSTDESLFPSTNEEWTWERVEAERLKGLKFAEHFAALDALLDTFDGEGPVMGKWRDIYSI